VKSSQTETVKESSGASKLDKNWKWDSCICNKLTQCTQCKWTHDVDISNDSICTAHYMDTSTALCAPVYCVFSAKLKVL